MLTKNYFIHRFMIILPTISIFGVTGLFAQIKQELINTGQNTDYITYQGRLLTGGTPANGTYDFEFTITNEAGNVVQTVQSLGVQVTNGIFTTRLQVNVATFNTNGGGYVGVGVRQLPTDSFTPLGPRQPISTTPFAIKARTSEFSNLANDSNQLGGVDWSQYVLAGDGRLYDARQPLPGSASYVQNQNTATQQIADFNISGYGNARAFNARSYYALNDFTILAAPGNANIFVGVGAGDSNTTGADNAFLGRDAGLNNVLGSANSFFGSGAGKYSLTGGNSFFGYHSGYFTTTGDANAFFGWSAGFLNSTGFRNTFLGSEAGYSNTNGSRNVFLGALAGKLSKASENTIVGAEAGVSTTSGASNSIVGAYAGFANSTGEGNTFFGVGSGYSNTDGAWNTFQGFQSGNASTTGGFNTFIGHRAGITNTGGSNNTAIGAGANVTDGNLSFATAVGAGAVVDSSNTVVIGRPTDFVYVPGSLGVSKIPGFVTVGGLSVESTLKIDTRISGGSRSLCLESHDYLALCSSSIRYKKDVADFKEGLDLVRRLRPVTFRWKSDDSPDLGFIAEEVNEVEPLLSTHNNTGQVDGVKYDRISTALVNAVKEQQDQIEHQRDEIKQLREQIDELKKLASELAAKVGVTKAEGEKK